MTEKPDIKAKPMLYQLSIVSRPDSERNPMRVRLMTSGVDFNLPAFDDFIGELIDWREGQRRKSFCK